MPARAPATGDRGKLHFAYNVDGTPAALAKDFVHRIVSPETYPCKLCDLTYGRFIKKAGWRAFTRRLPLRCEFHLRGAFRRKHPRLREAELPAVFLERPAGTLRPLITAGELAGLRDLNALQSLLKKRIAATAPTPARRARGRSGRTARTPRR